MPVRRCFPIPVSRRTRGGSSGHSRGSFAGASALLAGLVVSGLPTDQFHFAGFLPAKQGQRTRLLESLRDEPATLIFYEAPHRILDSLEDIAATLGDREIVVARELTKIHEEVLRGTAAEIRTTLAARDMIRGEFVVLIAKASEPVHDDTPPEEAVALWSAPASTAWKR